MDVMNSNLSQLLLIYLYMYLFVDSLIFFSFFLSILQIKGSFTGKRGQEKVNPYSKGGVCANCIFILCGPMPPSFIGQFSSVTLYQRVSVD